MQSKKYMHRIICICLGTIFGKNRRFQFRKLWLIPKDFHSILFDTIGVFCLMCFFLISYVIFNCFWWFGTSYLLGSIATRFWRAPKLRIRARARILPADQMVVVVKSTCVWNFSVTFFSETLNIVENLRKCLWYFWSLKK